MKFPRLLTILLLVLAFGSTYYVQDCRCQQYYQGGDINYDGWCNWADFNILQGYFAGFCNTNDFCMDGADFDGLGQVNGTDLTKLFMFLMGTGTPPVGSCPDVSRTCDLTEQAMIWLIPVADGDPDQATFSVYVGASTDIGALNFSFEYNPAEIAAFSTANHSDVSGVSLNERPFTGIIAFLVLCEENGSGRNYPMGAGGTRIFDIVVDRQAGAPNSMLRIVEDPIHGPPYFYFGGVGHCAGEDIICPFVPFTVTGDVNGSGSYNGLDITYGVSYLKGGPKPIDKYFYNVPVQWDY